MPVDGPLKKRTAVRTRRYVQDHRYAGLTGSISQPVTEFTYNRKRQRPPPPPRSAVALVHVLCFLFWACRTLSFGDFKGGDVCPWATLFPP